MKTAPTSRIVLLATVAAMATASATLTGCDTGGIYPLLDRADILIPCGSETTTWLASTPEGTEIFLIGSLDPSVPLAEGTRACFAHGFVDRDSSTTYASGTYAMDALGNAAFTYETSYLFAYQPSRSILSRDGSKATTHDVPVVETLAIASEGAGLAVTLNGTVYHLTNLYDLVGRIDTSTQAGAEDLFRVLNLPLFTSQARLIGFGSGSMTRYVGATTYYQGALAAAEATRNEFSVRVASLANPNTDIRYFTFADLSGMSIDGLQRTLVDAKGNGTMEGILTWSMNDGPAASDVAYEGTLDYANLVIGDGHASGGTYALTITSPAPATFTIPYTLANDVELTGSLPIP